MPLLRCASCCVNVELADAVTVARCGVCGSTLLPTTPGVVVAALDDDPTQPHRERARAATQAPPLLWPETTH